MHGGNHWGGELELVNNDNAAVHSHEIDTGDHSNNMPADLDRAAVHSQRFRHLDETQQGWLLGPQIKDKKKKYVDLCCVIVSRRALKWTLGSLVVAFLVIGLPIIIAKALPKHKPSPPPPDDYAVALKQALRFFNAQKSGELPENNGVPWRGNSGLQDGSKTDVKGGLVGGYYDAGDNTKFHFPMSFAMTMLSWSLIEYSKKYQYIGQYDHTRELIRWGTDYLLRTFNSSADRIDKIYAQVGGAQNGSSVPNDRTCWERPEDMDYDRPVQVINAGPDLAGEMAAALAAASIVFRDDPAYSKALVKGAETVFDFARDNGRRQTYCRGNAFIQPYYNSSGYYDEYMWGAAWLYYATGNVSYVKLATDPGLPMDAKAFDKILENGVLSWDNKLPAAMLLLTRFRIFLNPGYPYEEMLHMYHDTTSLTMCSYLRQFHVFNWTGGGMIQLNMGRPQPLQYTANAAFLASLYIDYMNATDVPGFVCGPSFIPLAQLRSFATSQIDYILGENPMKMSYVVGFGKNFSRHVHHRGASIPRNGVRYSCEGGWRWFRRRKANPYKINGAMVAGPDRFDRFSDNRTKAYYTEPTLAGNSGLVAALASLTSSGGYGVDRNTIFAAVPPIYPQSPPPPPPWKP